MTEILQDYVWETDKNELQGLIKSGCEVIYSDINLSVIYEEIAGCFKNNEVHKKIKEHFGFYGLSALLYVNGVYYWIMQV